MYLTAEQKDALREIFGKFDNGTGAITAKARTLVVQKRMAPRLHVSTGGLISPFGLFTVIRRCHEMPLHQDDRCRTGGLR